MNTNYNRFIACWLANSIDLLFDSDEFDNFQKSYKQYIVEPNMKIIQQGLSVVDDIMYI